MKINENVKGFNQNGLFWVDRSLKGSNLLSFPSSFVAIDIETTGLSPEYDTIIELGAVKVTNFVVTDTFASLVRYDHDLFIDEYITQLTGITQEMIDNAPNMENVLPAFLDFVSDSVLLGHNVSFDINFIYDEMMQRYNKPFSNSFVDTIRISRRLHPEERHHRLSDLAKRYGIEQSATHRALADCLTTIRCYNAIIADACALYGSETNFINQVSFSHGRSVRASDITSDVSVYNPLNPFYGKVCVITGKLDKMTRREAMQLIADIGGVNGDSVTKKTNYLILGCNDYCASIKGGKSNKHKKAEQLKLDGYDIEIIPENVFYEMMDEQY